MTLLSGIADIQRRPQEGKAEPSLGEVAAVYFLVLTPRLPPLRKTDGSTTGCSLSQASCSTPPPNPLLSFVQSLAKLTALW